MSTDSEQGNIPEWVIPLILEIVRLSGKLLWLTLTAIGTGLKIGYAVLTDEERQFRAQRWLLLTGSRWMIVSGLVTFVFWGALLLGFISTINLTETSFVTTVFGAVIGGLFSFVPIVIAVNQLTISQLVATPDKLRTQIEGIREFRAGIAEQIPDKSVAPGDPAHFLAEIVQLVAEQGTVLRQAELSAHDDPQVAETLYEYGEAVHVITTDIDKQVAEDDLQLFDVLLPLMGDPYSQYVTTARRILAEHADDLSEQTTEALVELRDLFVMMDVLRQYFKALYVRQELARLSRLIAYTGIGAFIISIFILIVYTSGNPAAGQLVIVEILVTTALAVAILPFAVLFAFVIRLATIAKRTVAPGAFTLDQQPLTNTPREIRRAGTAEKRPQENPFENNSVENSKDMPDRFGHN